MRALATSFAHQDAPSTLDASPFGTIGASMVVRIPLTKPTSDVPFVGLTSLAGRSFVDANAYRVYVTPVSPTQTLHTLSVP